MEENITPRLIVQLRDIYKDDKILKLTDIDSIKCGPALIWLLFPNKDCRNKANNILLTPTQSAVMPEFIDGKLYALAYLADGGDSIHSIKRIIKTCYQQDGFSGQFNFNVIPQSLPTFLLTLISNSHQYVVMLDGVCRVEYRYGQYSIFFKREKDFLFALKKTFWQPCENNGLIVEISSSYHIKIYPKGRNRFLSFDQMVFA